MWTIKPMYISWMITIGIIFHYPTSFDAFMSSEEKEEPKISVLMVCIGNICRSPIAEKVFIKKMKDRKLENKFECKGAALYGYHVGEGMDKRSKRVLKKHNLDTNHRATLITNEDFKKYTYIFAMDPDILGRLKRLAPVGCPAKLELFPKYDRTNEDIYAIRDPYYDLDNEGFETCYQISLRACERFFRKYEYAERKRLEKLYPKNDSDYYED